MIRIFFLRTYLMDVKQQVAAEEEEGVHSFRDRRCCCGFGVSDMHTATATAAVVVAAFRRKRHWTHYYQYIGDTHGLWSTKV